MCVCVSVLARGGVGCSEHVLNPDITDIFAEYSRGYFKEFGEKVKPWFIINELNEEAVQAYYLH